MIAGFPDELLDELTEAWTMRERGRAEVILRHMKRLQSAMSNTRKAVELVFEHPDDLDALIELAKQKANQEGRWPDTTFILKQSLQYEIGRRVAKPAYPGDRLHDAFKTLEWNRPVNFELLADIILYRVRATEIVTAV